MGDRWARTRIIVGDRGVERLAAARVLVVGLGGVGSFAAEALVRAGIGTMGLVDFDVVEISNINRQLLALSSSVGRIKVQLLEERCRDINPNCIIEPYPMRCNADTIGLLLGNQPEYVVDAIDSVDDKILLIQACLARQIPIISAMGTGNRIDPCQFRVADISNTHTCPLARRVRRELGRVGITKGLKVVFSEEQPLKGADGTTIGSISYMPSTAGLIMAGEVIRSIAGGIESGVDTSLGR